MFANLNVKDLSMLAYIFTFLLLSLLLLVSMFQVYLILDHCSKNAHDILYSVLFN